MIAEITVALSVFSVGNERESYNLETILFGKRFDSLPLRSAELRSL